MDEARQSRILSPVMAFSCLLFAFCWALPQKLSEGVEKVFVNGEWVWDAGKAAGARPGHVFSR